MIQVIVYSIATGRVRRVHDPQTNVSSVIAFLNQVAIVTGEARLVYNKQGAGADTLFAWQVAVNAHTGLTPEITQGDWYCGVDGSNNILWWGCADPACGDAVSGLVLVGAPWGADSRWIYNGVVFVPPVVIKGLGK